MYRHLVTLGGSITTGYAASDRSERSWASRVARGLALQSGPDFRWTDRGVSGTDSVSAALRGTAHAEDSDLVIVEQAVNDQWLDPCVAPASYEGLLRQLLLLPTRPAVLCLLLSERDVGVSHASEVQRTLAEYYGLAWVRPDLSGVAGAFGPDDGIHPLDSGHEFIANEVLAALAAGLGPAKDPLPPPLFGSDWMQPWLATPGSGAAIVQRDWKTGSDVHTEWQHHGGAPSGWSTTADTAELAVEVSGTVVGVLISESEHYRNLEAWLDDGPRLILKAHRPDRAGYLGWSWHALARQLPAGRHVLHLRPAVDQWQGRGRPVHVVAVVGAGPRHVARLLPGEPGPGFSSPGRLNLLTTGRFAPGCLPSLTLGWSLTSVAGNFSGSELALALERTRDRVLVRLLVDGRAQTFELPEGSCTLVASGLTQGNHSFELVKLSEGLFGSTQLAGLRLGASEGHSPTWLPPPKPPKRRIEVYGDSITAGACNLDVQDDQYDRLDSHDPTLTYVALTARRWEADVVALAVSGTGLTCSWNPILLPEVADRWLPDCAAEVSASDREPDLVLVNLGTNDLGFPESQGQGLSPGYEQALVDFVHILRRRNPRAWIVGALGGIYAPGDALDLREAWRRAWATLAAADARVRSFEFQTSSPAHPRVDAHIRMSDELLAFLTKEIPL